jgi:hypothetical protein
MDSEIITFDAYPRKAEVEYRMDSFRPNRVSEAFLEAIPKDLTGLIVDDIGSGGGVIAIVEGYRGAKEVRAVEPADANFSLLLKNIEKNNLQGIIKAYQGKYFDPIKDHTKADIISADVSGITDTFARALGWYPDGIPTGGDDGTEITCELLRRAPKYIKPDGRLYFPTANDLLDYNKILDIAKENFEHIENALCSSNELEEWNRKANESSGKLWKSPEFVWFHLRDEDIKAIDRAYKSKIPNNINLQRIKDRYFWRGQIYVASEPKI